MRLQPFPLTRGKYATWGCVLFAIKYNLDRFIAAEWFHRPGWTPLNYFFEYQGHRKLDFTDAREFYLTLGLVAVPFIAIGIWLTVRRLIDAGKSPWLSALFFLPFINLLFFLALSIIPSRGGPPDMPPIGPGRCVPAWLRHYIPDRPLGAAALAVLITSLATVPLVLFATNTLNDYGWGLFVGIPFFQGFLAAMLANTHHRLSAINCVYVAMMSVALTGVAIFALAFEGILCLLMAAPLGLALAILGGLVARWTISYGHFSQADAAKLSCAAWLLLPIFMAADAAEAPQPPMQIVTSSVRIDASPEKVWPKVIAFSQIPPPHELIFRSGISYPLYARIDGVGVGATRHCVFSTGEFVEPIKAWNAPHELRFGVKDQPEPMKELSIYPNIHTAHLDGYFESHEGQFLLQPQPDGTTLLVGTTWYTNRMWPQAYWQLWSDYLIHHIHLRVLEHIKTDVEGAR